jgi:uncharacterized membrane protein YeaQ/YmgE (transglycosylase-associated protein family)
LKKGIGQQEHTVFREIQIVTKEKIMNLTNLIIYLVAGAIVGYIASRIMRTNSQQGLLLDIVVGVVGAFLAGYFISPRLGVGTINDAITIPTMLVTLLGSIILLAIYKLLFGKRRLFA